MSALVLPKRKIALYQRRTSRRKLCTSQILRTEKAIHRTCCNFSQKHPTRIGPCIAIGIGISIPCIAASADKQRRWSAQRDQLVIIHRQIARIQLACIAQKVSIKPVIQRCACKVWNRLSINVPIQLRAALAGRTDVSNRKFPVLVSHRDQHGLAKPGMSN